MRIISVILDPAAIKTILDHLKKKKDGETRGPPTDAQPLAAAS